MTLIQTEEIFIQKSELWSVFMSLNKKNKSNDLYTEIEETHLHLCHGSTHAARVYLVIYRHGNQLGGGGVHRGELGPDLLP